LNDSASLLATHDKLLTARLLRRAGVPHPLTRHVRADRPLPELPLPVVVKPRFGSGGREVYLCEDDAAFVDTLASVDAKSWFRAHGALAQELIPPRGYDLRVLVATEHVAGAVFRVVAKGEWRTNVTLGAVRRPVADPPREACEIAVAAARAVASSLVGVDLMLDTSGRWTVIELNGAVEFTDEYDAEGAAYSKIALALARAAQALVPTTWEQQPVR
jgi:RimK family alpha-L-glutamate ligase